MTKKILNVLFASNNDFSPYLGVSLYSLLEHNSKEFSKIKIYVFDDGISNENKTKLIDVASSFNQEIEFIKVNDLNSVTTNVQTMDKDGISSLTTYSRLFASSALPDIDKILYLDADSLITGSYKELWDLNIDDYYVAGVEDLLSIDFVKNEIEMAPEDRYINAGFLLINLKKWRENNIEKKFFEFQKNHSNKFIYHDQGIINGVCKGNIRYVHPKYNLISIFHGINYKTAMKLCGLDNYLYDETTITDAQNNPVFIHFSGGILNRPWSNKSQPYHKFYYEYAKKTPFINEIETSEIPLTKSLFYKAYKSKFASLLLKLIPMSISVKIANKRVKNVAENEISQQCSNKQ